MLKKGTIVKTNHNVWTMGPAGYGLVMQVDIQRRNNMPSTHLLGVFWFDANRRIEGIKPFMLEVVR